MEHQKFVNDTAKGLENVGGLNFERMLVAGVTDCTTSEVSKVDQVAAINNRQQSCKLLAVESTTMACKEQHAMYSLNITWIDSV